MSETSIGQKENSAPSRSHILAGTKEGTAKRTVELSSQTLRVCSNPRESAKAISRQVKHLGSSERQLKVLERRMGTSKVISLRSNVSFRLVDEHRVVIQDNSTRKEISFWIKKNEIYGSTAGINTMELESSIIHAQKQLDGISSTSPQSLSQVQLLHNIDEVMEIEESYSGDQNNSIDQTARQLEKNLQVKDNETEEVTMGSDSHSDPYFSEPERELVPAKDIFSQGLLARSGQVEVADMPVLLLQPKTQSGQSPTRTDGVRCLFEAYHHLCVGTLYAAHRSTSFVSTLNSQPPSLTSGRPTRLVLDFILKKMNDGARLWHAFVACALHKTSVDALAVEVGRDEISADCMRTLVSLLFEEALHPHVSVFDSVDDLHHNAHAITLFPHAFLYRTRRTSGRLGWSAVTMMPDLDSGRRVAIIRDPCPAAFDFQSAVRQAEKVQAVRSQEDRYLALRRVLQLAVGYRGFSAFTRLPQSGRGSNATSGRELRNQERNSNRSNSAQSLGPEGSDAELALLLKDVFEQASATPLHCCSGTISLRNHANPALVLVSAAGESTVLPFPPVDADLSSSVSSLPTGRPETPAGWSDPKSTENQHMGAPWDSWDGSSSGSHRPKPKFSPLSPARKNLKPSRTPPTFSLGEPAHGSRSFALEKSDQLDRRSFDAHWHRRPGSTTPKGSPTLSPAHRRCSSEFNCPGNIFLDNPHLASTNLLCTVDVCASGVLQEVKNLLFPLDQRRVRATLCGLHTSRAGNGASVPGSPRVQHRRYFDGPGRAHSPNPSCEDELFVPIGGAVTANPLDSSWLLSAESHDTVGLLVVYLPSSFAGGQVSFALPDDTEAREADPAVQVRLGDRHAPRELFWFAYRTRPSQASPAESGVQVATKPVVSGQYFRLVYLLQDADASGRRERAQDRLALPRSLSLPLLPALADCLGHPGFMKHGGFIAVPFAHRLCHTSGGFMADMAIRQQLQGVDEAVFESAKTAGLHVSFMAAYHRFDAEHLPGDQDGLFGSQEAGAPGPARYRAGFGDDASMQGGEPGDELYEKEQNAAAAEAELYQVRYPLLLKRNYVIAPFQQLHGSLLHRDGCAMKNSSSPPKGAKSYANRSGFPQQFSSTRSDSGSRHLASNSSGSVDGEGAFWSDDPFLSGFSRASHLVLWLGDPQHWEVARIVVPHDECAFDMGREAEHGFAEQGTKFARDEGDASGCISGKRKQSAKMLRTYSSEGPFVLANQREQRRNSRHSMTSSDFSMSSGLATLSNLSNESSQGSQASKFAAVEGVQPEIVQQRSSCSQQLRTKVVYSTAIMLLHIPTPTQRITSSLA